VETVVLFLLTSAHVATPRAGPTEPKTPQKKRRMIRAIMLMSADESERERERK
jgi:hypothetical protein